MVTIIVPKAFTAETVFRFETELFAMPEDLEYVFDFEHEVIHAEPFGMLLGGCLFRRFKRERIRDRTPQPRFLTCNFEKAPYAAHMGFFESFGVPIGNKPGQAPGSSRYIPITSLAVPGLQDQAMEKSVAVGDIIENEAHRLAKLLAQSEAGDLVDTLSYSFREIFRNVVEHSQADKIWYAAQFWPSKQKVQIAILDEGIGIRASLSQNTTLSISDDSTALTLAILPGVSRVRKTDKYDVWGNAGYGLYITSKLCVRGGFLELCSGTKGLSLFEKGYTVSDTFFNGTALKLVFDTSKITSLQQFCKEIVREAKNNSTPAKRLSASQVHRILKQ